ncbi:16S rRNA (guanine(966)-N(2))-methyltransferase RsmD [Pseudoalteromonas tunicata]|uniref:16S rRNA (guanine(966)-N(2))-methyltransferase RsmD n=1 Tax=Pseudoalteromonas tunicata TaxID=314281 RepID=UPI00273DCEFD|nr:16S rRNA (guanine(966)-N(2))-methyltransferase RsmD [Pseudoalteromonas tunicata]MDP5214359.1 16S rRNA (guanine(966)-N(2))-methyltransferase RsmD [Pseudoalteromonas tunicata]
MKPNTSKSNKSTSGQIRIISGQYRGRKLPVKDVQGLRPTTDRVKETVFNWLMNDVRDTVVLDCFAGSGGLGFEALSRYASSVTFIEKDKIAAQQIESNISTLKNPNANLVHGDALQFIATNNRLFNLVFIDPPFRQGLAQPLCDLLVERNALAQDALIYLEVENELSDFKAPVNWSLKKEKTAGQVSYRLYQNGLVNN